MDPDTFLGTLQANHETELSRLASSKVLYALTGGELEAEAVVAVTRARAAAAASTFDAWAADAADAGAAETFEAAAAALRADADAIGANGGDREGLPDPGPLFDRLAGLTAPVDRAAGLAAWSLVEDGVRRQAVGFFVGNADPASADQFRERRATVEDLRDDALGLLGVACADEADWDRAADAGGAAIEAAYEQYVTLLEGMGVTVKPVC